MAYTIPNMTSGIDDVIGDVAVTVPIFTPMLLFFIFAVIFITGYKKQLKNTGQGDAPVWATLSGMVTSVMALFLSLGTNMIDLGTLVITIMVTIFCGMWLFASRDKT